MEIKTHQDVITAWDDLPFVNLMGTKVCALRTSDMETAIVAIDAPPHARYPSHFHVTGHVEVVLDGSMDAGDGRIQKAGDVRIVDANVPYGPLVVGADGCKALEILPHPEAFAGVLSDPDDAATYGVDYDAFNAELLKLFTDQP